MPARGKLLLFAALIVILGVALAGLALQDDGSLLPGQSTGTKQDRITSFLVREETVECEATFAVIGDFGLAGPAEAAVAKLVHGWQLDFVVTTGDNNYPHGAAVTLDQNVGQYYSRYIYPYRGRWERDATVNRFFPSLGNHDWETQGAVPYLDYFTLPGNERYYEVEWGPVHLFVVDSDPSEPDGISATSKQARWLKERLATSRLPWQVVAMHHPPYSSASNHGSTPQLQWPFGEWGADLVLAGHDHTYERLSVDSVTYVVNGLGGNERYGFGSPLPATRARYQADFGALRVEADADTLTFSFYTQEGNVIDSATLQNPQAQVHCGELPENS